MTTQPEDHDNSRALPDTFLRGIRKRQQGPKLAFDVFIGMAPKTPRSDGGQEASINWEDDDHSLAQIRTNKSNCQHGVARVRWTAASELLATNDAWCKLERRVENGNPYHGNIVYLDEAEGKRIWRLIAGLFALAAVVVDTNDGAHLTWPK